MLPLRHLVRLFDIKCVFFTYYCAGNMLNFNTHLVELNLQETGLGNTGATMVAQALHVNTVGMLWALSSSCLTSLPHLEH